jgi:hypothetical protein
MSGINNNNNIVMMYKSTTNSRNGNINMTKTAGP